MSDWFRKIIEKHKKKPTPVARDPIQSHREKDSCVKTGNLTHSKMSPTSSMQPTVMRSIGCSGRARWIKPFDVCICHSQQDSDYVMQLVSYLEQQPEELRCFLQLRDAALGGAIPTELCQAVRNSHCWVMLITQNFLQDPWCKYQMHQALAEAPITNGRTIPVVKDLDRAYYPEELRFMYYIRVTLDMESDFWQIKRAILLYLQDLGSNEIFISESDSNLNSTIASHLSSESPSSNDQRTDLSDNNPSTENTSSSETQIDISDSHQSSERTHSQSSSECTCRSDCLLSNKSESDSLSNSECACKSVTERSISNSRWNSQSGNDSHLSSEHTSHK